MHPVIPTLPEPTLPELHRRDDLQAVLPMGPQRQAEVDALVRGHPQYRGERLEVMGRIERGRRARLEALPQGFTATGTDEVPMPECTATVTTGGSVFGCWVDHLWRAPWTRCWTTSVAGRTFHVATPAAATEPTTTATSVRCPFILSSLYHPLIADRRETRGCPTELSRMPSLDRRIAESVRSVEPRISSTAAGRGVRAGSGFRPSPLVRCRRCSRSRRASRRGCRPRPRSSCGHPARPRSGRGRPRSSPCSP